MAVVIFEGPDEGGKTTLLEATSAMLKELVIPHRSLKSPAGRTQEWDTDWDRWALANNEFNRLVLLDRTPEISELVYGTVRNKMRLRFPLDGLAQLCERHIFLVFCLPAGYGHTLQVGKHRDPFNNDMADATEVPILYEMLWYLFTTGAWAKAGMPLVHRYDYVADATHWSRFATEFLSWLGSQGWMIPEPNETPKPMMSYLSEGRLE